MSLANTQARYNKSGSPLKSMLSCSELTSSEPQREEAV